MNWAEVQSRVVMTTCLFQAELTRSVWYCLKLYILTLMPVLPFYCLQVLILYISSVSVYIKYFGRPLKIWEQLLIRKYVVLSAACQTTCMFDIYVSEKQYWICTTQQRPDFSSVHFNLLTTKACNCAGNPWNWIAVLVCTHISTNVWSSVLQLRIWTTWYDGHVSNDVGDRCWKCWG
jgi:hypothetical protein